MELHKENLYHCPICKDKLESYSLMGIMEYESCYCPKCNIVRESMMSLPVLCERCNSTAFYRNVSELVWNPKEGDYICWYCGNKKFKVYKVDDAERKGLFETEGYKLSVQSVKTESMCKHEHMTNKRHNAEIFKFTCSDCNGVIYAMIPEWMQKERNIKDEWK